MIETRAVQIGALVWAMASFTVAAVSIATVDSGALPLVAFASMAFPLCAAAAAFAAAQGRLRTAGVLLLLSVATPTYFAWVLSLPALLVGGALLVAPRLTVRSREAGPSQA